MANLFNQKRKGYLGNPNLKAVGEHIDFTPEQQIEVAKCAADWRYFIQTYVTIVTTDHGKIKFPLRKYQDTFLERIVLNRFNIIMIPRQYGKSEAVAAILLWYVIFNPDYRIAVLAHKQKKAAELLHRIKLAYELLPRWMQQGVKEWNKGNIALENDSSIVAEATSADSVRGNTYNIVYLDEFAHVEPHEQEAFFTGTYPVITSGTTTKMIITSTPKGLEKFHEIWKKSEQGKNSYVRTEVKWWDMPGREVPGPGEAWAKEQIDNTSERQFSQEFGCSFLGSMSTLIDGHVLAQHVTEDPISMEDQDGKTLYIFEKPIPNHSYVMTVDVAKGVGGDHSAFCIIDTTTIPYKVVATFYNNMISYLVLPNRLYEWANKYNKAYVLVELNELGQSVADALYYEYEYENLFMTQAKPKVGQVLNAGYGGAKIEFGVRMNKQVKRVGCSSLKPIIETNKIKLMDNRIITELSHFVEKGPSWAAEKDKHDDLVMCLVSFAWLTSQSYFTELSGTNVNRSILKDAMTMLEQEIPPAGFYQDATTPDRYDWDDDLTERDLARETIKQTITEAKANPEFTKEQIRQAEELFKLYGV